MSGWLPDGACVTPIGATSAFWSARSRACVRISRGFTICSSCGRGRRIGRGGADVFAGRSGRKQMNMREALGYLEQLAMRRFVATHTKLVQSYGSHRGRARVDAPPKDGPVAAPDAHTSLVRRNAGAAAGDVSTSALRKGALSTGHTCSVGDASGQSRHGRMCRSRRTGASRG